jgi:hypothetical protein
MDLRRIACLAALSLAVAGAARADDTVVPCKNHYILVDTCGSTPPVTEKGAGTFRFANVYSSPSGGYHCSRWSSSPARTDSIYSRVASSSCGIATAASSA